MAIEFTRSDPEVLAHPEAQTPLERAINPVPLKAPTPDEVLDHIQDRANAILAPHENTVMTVARAEDVKRQLALLPSISGVGLSAVEGLAEVILRAVVAGAETWFTAKFPVVTPVADPVDQPTSPAPEKVAAREEVR